MRMIKRWGMVLLALVLAMLVACNNDDEPTNDEATTDEEDELVALEVEFNVPETADADETVELEAIVTFGDEMVDDARSEEHTSELQSRGHLVCRLLLEKKKEKNRK